MAGFPASNKIPYLENVRQIIFVHFNEIFERINLRENYFWDTYFVGRGDFCIQNLKFLKIYFYGDMFQLTFYSIKKKMITFLICGKIKSMWLGGWFGGWVGRSLVRK